MPSYREGFQNINKAAACGRPVVTTNVPGCRDAILNGSTGILVPAKNSKNLLRLLLSYVQIKKITKHGNKSTKTCELF